MSIKHLREIPTASPPAGVLYKNSAIFDNKSPYLANDTNDIVCCQVRKGVFKATQLNSTKLNWPSWTAYSQVSRVFVYDVMAYKLSQLLFNWVTTFIDRWQLFTLWTCRQLDVELSSVELCRYKRALIRDDNSAITIEGE